MVKGTIIWRNVPSVPADAVWIEAAEKLDIVGKAILFVWQELPCINGKNPVLQGNMDLVRSSFPDVA